MKKNTRNQIPLSMRPHSELDQYLINKAWTTRRTGDFVNWEDVRDQL